MRMNYVMIDFENVQPESLAALQQVDTITRDLQALFKPDAFKTNL